MKWKLLLEIVDKLLSIVPGNGHKTLAGAIMVLIGALSIKFGLPQEAIVYYVSQVGEWLFALGLVHWRIKDILAKA